MPRVYIDKFAGSPLFSNERGVGVKMQNDPKDVKLVQFFLKAILHSNKIFLAGNTRFTPPEGGSPLNVTGAWDEASRRYLSRWEQLRSEAKAYWAHGHDPGPQFPGTVVPYAQGGKKIQAMNEMLVVMFGKDNHAKLKLPGMTLDRDVWHDLFWDPVRHRKGGPS